MTSRYLCKKCMFDTNKFSGIQRHLNKKNSCKKNLEAFNYSDDQLLILSLLHQSDDFEKIKEEISHLKNSNIIHKNKDKLFKDINYIDKNKSKKCIYCDEDFDKILYLKKHILINCFYNELRKKNDNNIINSSSNLDLKLESTSNLDLKLESTSNSIYTYSNIKNPIPFDSEWNLSHIDKNIKERISFTKRTYTRLLEEILKNEINLNVIIDKNNNSGIVYKNDFDQYVQMEIKDIIDNTIYKLNKHLLDINIDINDDIMNEIIYNSKNIINYKYNNYKNNEDIKKNVINLISNIFEEKKENSLIISSNNIKKNINKYGY